MFRHHHLARPPLRVRGQEIVVTAVAPCIGAVWRRVQILARFSGGCGAVHIVGAKKSKGDTYMPEKKNSAAEVLTGSTGNAKLDMPPRAAAGLVLGFAAGASLAAIGVDKLAIGGLSTATAVLVLAGFDEFVKPLIKRR